MPDSTRLYLVRHGETEHNRRQLIQGRGIDSMLNENGRLQADRLALWLSDVSFDAAYCSTLRRARATAEIILGRQRPVPNLEVMPGLDEMSWGILEGRPQLPPAADVLDGLKSDWMAGRFEGKVDGGESILDVQRRSVGALEEIVRRQAGKTVLVVTHGRLLRVLLSSIIPGWGLTRMEEMGHSNTGVNIIDSTADGYIPVALNLTEHLEPRAA